MKDYTKVTQSVDNSAVGYDEGLRNHMVGVYKNMSLALLVSGLIAFLQETQPPMLMPYFLTLSYITD